MPESRPDRLLDKQTHDLWHAQAEQGVPPDITTVVQKQYGLETPWHVRDHLWRDAQDLGSWDHVEKRAKVISRGHGKTVGGCLLVLYLAEYVIPYMDGLMTNRTMNVVGRSEDHIHGENMEQLRTLICRFAPWLKTKDEDRWEDWNSLHDWKMKSRPWGVKKLRLTNNVTVDAYGMNQSVRSSHVYFTWMDDFIDEDNAHRGRQQLEEKVMGAIEPAMEDGGLLLLTGTLIDDNDIWAYIEDEGDWAYDVLPAYDRNAERGYARRNKQEIENGFLPEDAITSPEDSSCLWPWRMDYASLEARRGDSRRAEVQWLREYMCQRTASFNQLVHPDDYHRSLSDRLYYIDALDDNSTAETFIGVDPSGLKRSNHVAVVGTITPDDPDADIAGGKVRPVHWDIIEAKEADTHEERKELQKAAKERLHHLYKRFRPHTIVIEGNAYQSTIEADLEAQYPSVAARVEQISLTSNKHKQDGWPLIRNRFAEGDIVLPYGPTPDEERQEARGEVTTGDYEARRITERFQHELEGVKLVSDGKEKKIREDEKRHTDRVAAFYFMLRAAEQSEQSPWVDGLSLEPDNADEVDVEEALLGRSSKRDPELASGEPSGPLQRVAEARKWDRFA